MKQKSPCIGICKLEANKCIGCLRTVDQIVKWSKLSNAEKDRIIEQIELSKKEK